MATPQSLSPASPRPGDLQVLRNILQRSYAPRPSHWPCSVRYIVSTHPGLQDATHGC